MTRTENLLISSELKIYIKQVRKQWHTGKWKVLLSQKKQLEKHIHNNHTTTIGMRLLENKKYRIFGWSLFLTLLFGVNMVQLFGIVFASYLL